MPFPEDALADHERLVLNLHPHIWVLIKPGAALVLAAGFGVWALSVNNAALSVLAAVLIVTAAGWFLSRFVTWYSTYFVLTSDRVMYRSGVVRRRSREIPLERINTVTTTQTLFERVLQIGDIEIESAATDGAQRFLDIRRPEDVQKEIYVQMESNENRKYDRISEATRAQAGPPALSISDQINQLADLRDRHVITEAEFQAKKTELLDRM